MKTWHLHIQGQVQGVGFRPFVYLLAKKMSLKGWVNNTLDGVHIAFNAEAAQAEAFRMAIQQDAPNLAHIQKMSLGNLPSQAFEDFRIIHSDSEGQPSLLISPDFGLCPNCRAELHNPSNRRYRYPFITCTHCGPRYAISQELPYDREHTTMSAFTMCLSCEQEYEQPTDRRYYSQTNACGACGIVLQLFADKTALSDLSTKQILSNIVEAWRAGKIVAIKGIGGYLLTCDAQNEASITRLRSIKQRPRKPFALMFPNLENLAKYAQIQEKEQTHLLSPAAPIVLLKCRPDAPQDLALEAIAPQLGKIGVMLPYTPLFELLLQDFGQAIVATSANVSHSPIIFDDVQALSELHDKVDLLLQDNRPLLIPQDDSLLQLSPFKSKKIILRRSRGLAPSYPEVALNLPPETALAFGAMLKSTFAIWHQAQVYLSQYLGDLSNFDCQQHYERSLEHLLHLLKAKPRLLLCDSHPNYPSSQLAEKLAESQGLSLQKVQHHIAHFAAVLAEHDLLVSSEQILGVIWDGTGFGEDGQIWGGEFFIYANYDFQRLAHLAYFPLIAGDKMAREPRLSALALSRNLAEAKPFLEKKFSPTEWQVYQQLLQQKPTLQTSSMGRLFDALAALLGLADQQTYEGEAALYLETLALEYFQKNGLYFTETYTLLAQGQSINLNDLLEQLLEDLAKNRNSAWIAAKFHFSLVKLVEQIAHQQSIQTIAFSGGVFQNTLLVDLMIHHLGHKFRLCFHENLSPNDENIAFGQLAFYQTQKQAAQIFLEENHPIN